MHVVLQSNAPQNRGTVHCQNSGLFSNSAKAFIINQPKMLMCSDLAMAASYKYGVVWEEKCEA